MASLPGGWLGMAGRGEAAAHGSRKSRGLGATRHVVMVRKMGGGAGADPVLSLTGTAVSTSVRNGAFI